VDTSLCRLLHPIGLADQRKLLVKVSLIIVNAPGRTAQARAPAASLPKAKLMKYSGRLRLRRGGATHGAAQRTEFGAALWETL
jgi:hypothetical protein